MRFLFPMCFFVFSFSQGLVDGIVAVVGNNMVLHSDVLQQTQILAASQRIDPTKRPLLFERMYVETLENIINQYAILDVAEKDSNLFISDDEVDRALELRINEFITQAGSRSLFEDAVGMSLRQIKLDYWPEIRNMMFIERFKFSKIQAIDVSRPEIEVFYNNYRDSIPSVPENYTFSVIEVPFVAGRGSEKKAYNFLDSLRGLVLNEGVFFDSLAIIYSQDPGSSNSGGLLGFTSRGTLLHSYEEAAYALAPGELSLPIRTEVGYHLIRLIERRGEKISSQHILLSISFSDNDKALSLTRIQHIYEQSYNDPFIFDSLAIEYDNNYDNFSGTYSKFRLDEIPFILLDSLNSLSLFSLSKPLETDEGYALVYLYEHSPLYVPSLENSWNLIYQYAKQKKQNIFFNSFVNKIKTKTFIKTLY